MLDKVTQIETIKYDRDVSYSYAASRLSTHWTNHNMAWSDGLYMMVIKVGKFDLEKIMVYR